MVQSHETTTAKGSQRNKGRYALIAVPVVVAGLALWYFTTAFLLAPTIDGPAADDVQGVVVTTGDEIIADGEVVAPNSGAETGGAID